MTAITSARNTMTTTMMGMALVLVLTMALTLLSSCRCDAFSPSTTFVSLSTTKTMPATVGKLSQPLTVVQSTVAADETATTTTSTTAKKTSSDPKLDLIPTKDVVKKVAVAGATGRTGKYVVEELLSRGVEVVALVRSTTKAEEELGNLPNVSILQCDLTNEDEISKAVDGCDATVWCATGFSDAKTGVLERVKRLLGIALAPQQSIDAVGIPAVGRSMLNQEGSSSGVRQGYPKVVMLSSAGVTRVSWSDEKKEKFGGCADIPIVRLNPFNILNIKADSEESLRKTGVNYCIVRPCGLNDDWPAGARPVFSQGDVAVGRINRKDVAKVLCDVLSSSEACDKTFEVIGLAGYPAPLDIRPALSRLKTDVEGVSESEVEAMYSLQQQLLPGEKQDAAALAMGQTYEQLDKGETGRLGERGTENAEAAAPKPTS